VEKKKKTLRPPGWVDPRAAPRPPKAAPKPSPRPPGANPAACTLSRRGSGAEVSFTAAENKVAA